MQRQSTLPCSRSTPRSRRRPCTVSDPMGTVRSQRRRRQRRYRRSHRPKRRTGNTRPRRNTGKYRPGPRPRMDRNQTLIQKPRRYRRSTRRPKRPPRQHRPRRPSRSAGNKRRHRRAGPAGHTGHTGRARRKRRHPAAHHPAHGRRRNNRPLRQRSQSPIRQIRNNLPSP